MPKASSDVDRKMASKMLRVSVRTIDRYIHSGKLPARQENGRIWLDKKTVLNFREGDSIPVPVHVDTRSTRLTRASTPIQNDTNFYQDLYGEARRALNEYQQKLEQANYRIGQLESQAFHPPLQAPKPIERSPDYHPSLDLLRKEVSDREKELSLIRDLAKKERANRIVFAILTYLLLILQPIFWYLLR